MLKKFLFFLFIIFFFLFFVYLGAALIYSQQKDISFIEEIRTDSKRIILQMKNVLYYEASQHNPEGDLIPDWVDDFVLGKIKQLKNNFLN